MKQKKFDTAQAKTDEKYRAKMVKGKHGWIVKGMLFATLLGGGMFLADTTEAYADAWAPNSVEQIASRIQPGQTSLVFEYGDTVWNIGLALNIKDPMQLLYDNGFKNGEQYSIQVGTIISWDGNHVTVTDPTGEVIGDSIVTDDQKHDASQTIAGQATDTPSKPVSNANGGSGSTTVPTTNKPTTGGNNSTGSANGGSSTNGNSTNKPDTGKPTTPETEKPVNPTDPTTPPEPEKPIDPTDPTAPPEPEKPVEPETPESLSELERLKKELAELESQLITAESELATAQENLANAQNGRTVEEIQADIEAVNQAMADKQAQAVVTQNELDSIASTLTEAQNETNALEAKIQELLVTQQSAQEAVNAAQEAYDAILETGDQFQIENAQEALNQAKNAYQSVTAEVTQAQNELSINTGVIADLNAQKQALNDTLNSLLDATAEQAKLAELEAELASATNQPSQEELQAIVDEKQAVVTDLKDQIETVKKKIAAIELKVSRETAINAIKVMQYLTSDMIGSYTNRINNAMTQGEIDTILAEAQAKNAELQAEAETAQALKNAKKDALAKLESMNLKDKKSSFVDQINSAESIEEVNSILVEAQKVSDQNDIDDEKETANQALKDAKDKAISKV